MPNNKTQAASLPETAEWKALAAHKSALSGFHLRRAFDENPQRFEQFQIRRDGILLDYSRNLCTDETMRHLFALARARDVELWRERMFTGYHVNKSEDRAVLHTALRAPKDADIRADGENVMPFVHEVLAHMEKFSNAVRAGDWKGHTGKKIADVVNLGIGGSDLGPRMVCESLAHLSAGGPRVHFVSNVDGAHLAETLAKLDPQTTLFLVASKSFTTQETMANAASARAWALAALKDAAAIKKHFVALSTNERAVAEFGIDPSNMFPFKDWVGGRFSLWSAIGLSVCLSVGFKNFRALLDGGHAMDRHFRTAPLESNMPVILALLGVWYRNFHDFPAYAVLPYAQGLAHFPAWLRQADMESNGKHVTCDGRAVDYATAPIVFGFPGTDGQHAFYQAIHQGTDVIPCDFIGAREATFPLPGHHRLLLANMVAQGQALMRGRTLEEAKGNAQKTFSGNRPSTTILLDRLDPYHLGQLLALYEHKVFVQGIIWGINSFDQWGVELGKTLANDILEIWAGAKSADAGDSSTAALIGDIKKSGI